VKTPAYLFSAQGRTENLGGDFFVDVPEGDVCMLSQNAGIAGDRYMVAILAHGIFGFGRQSPNDPLRALTSVSCLADR
jgi:hypothetical protein